MEMDSGRRQELMSRIFESLGKNPEKAEALIARMASPEEREQARKSIAAGKAQMLARFGEATDIQPANPEKWLEQIGGIDPQDSASYAPYLHQMEQWAPDKIAELSQQFSALPNDRKPQVARMLMAGITPVTGDAIRYLIDNPGTGPDGTAVNPVRLASEYASRLAFRDPASASQWVATLPAGEARLWAQKNVGRNWAVYDPKAAGQWVASLPAGARSEVRAFMEKGK
jgi:DNA-directed RNA polymerase subunit F